MGAGSPTPAHISEFPGNSELEAGVMVEHCFHYLPCQQCSIIIPNSMSTFPGNSEMDAGVGDPKPIPESQGNVEL